MAEFTADFEAGVSGATITTAGGEGSATAFNLVNGTPQYDSTHAAHGSLAMKIDATNEYVRWDQTFASDFYGRFYLYATALPSSSAAVLKINNGSQSTRIEIHDDGKVYTRDNTGTVNGAVQIATNQWVRLEWHFISSATVGLIEVRLFNTADSTTPTETINPTANRDTGATATAFLYIGQPDFGPWNTAYWIDDVVANATDWVGPVAAPPQKLLPTADSVDGAWTDQAGGTSLAAAIDEATFDDVDYIRSELNPSSSGCRIKLSAGGDPHLSTDHSIHWRTGKIGSATIDMTVKLYQGGGNSQGAGTLIASFDRTDVGALTSYTETLSGGEADSITDYTDLYLEFFADTA